MIFQENEDYAILKTESLQEVKDFNPEEGWEKRVQPLAEGEQFIIPESDDEFKHGSYGASSVERLLKGSAGEDVMKNIAQSEVKGMTATKANTRRRRRRKNEFDGDIDIDAVLGGDPQYYRKVERVQKKTKGVSILINISQPAQVDADKVAELTLNAMNKAYGYSMKGYSVEIKSIMSGYRTLEGSDKIALWEHVLKPHNRPFDKQRLYSSVYPALMRVFGFRAYGIIGYKTKKEVDFGLGKPVTSGVWDRWAGMSPELIKNIPGLNQDAYYFDMEVTEGKQVKNL